MTEAPLQGLPEVTRSANVWPLKHVTSDCILPQLLFSDAEAVTELNTILPARRQEKMRTTIYCLCIENPAHCLQVRPATHSWTLKITGCRRQLPDPQYPLITQRTTGVPTTTPSIGPAMGPPTSRCNGAATDTADTVLENAAKSPPVKRR